MREHGFQEGLGETGELRVHLELHARGQKGEALQQALHVGIGALEAFQPQPARNLRVLLGELAAHLTDVLQFAVDVLQVKHILVVGHYGCGGVSAAVDGARRGLVDHWLHPIREVAHAHRHALDAIAGEQARLDRLCELNVVRQVRNVASDVFVQEAWRRGQDLHVHGWVYSLASGLVTDLDATVGRPEELERLG